MVGLSFVDNSDCGWMLRSPLALAHVACGAAGEGRVRQQRVRLRVWDRFWCMVLRVLGAFSGSFSGHWRAEERSRHRLKKEVRNNNRLKKEVRKGCVPVGWRGGGGRRVGPLSFPVSLF